MLDVVRADFAGDNVGCWMQIQVRDAQIIMFSSSAMNEAPPLFNVSLLLDLIQKSHITSFKHFRSAKVHGPLKFLAL